MEHYNPDPRLRKLERLAIQGDVDAAREFVRAAARARDPEAVSRAWDWITEEDHRWWGNQYWIARGIHDSKPEENPAGDAWTRELERRAAGGDPQAEEQLARVRRRVTGSAADREFHEAWQALIGPPGPGGAHSRAGLRNLLQATAKVFNRKGVEETILTRDPVLDRAFGRSSLNHDFEQGRMFGRPIYATVPGHLINGYTIRIVPSSTGYFLEATLYATAVTEDEGEATDLAQKWADDLQSELNSEEGRIQSYHDLPSDEEWEYETPEVERIDELTWDLTIESRIPLGLHHLLEALDMHVEVKPAPPPEPMPAAKRRKKKKRKKKWKR